ncbi:MAG: hypothetical protein ACLPN6_30175 [Streptosporangiaceae bacterium]|nr:hypothetical protein [Actinomycetota bacterium]
MPAILAVLACLVLLAGGIHAVLEAGSGRRAAQSGSPSGGAAGGSSSAGSHPAGRGAGASGLSASGARAAGRRAALSARAASLVFCPASPAPALRQPLRQALASAVPGSASAEVLPLGVSSDGRTAYVSAWTPQFAGVAALNLASGALRKIQVFADPATDQADGSSGGRWLVWAETYSLSSLDDFTIFAWDSATGHRLRLGHSIAGPDGVPWPSPWHAPAVSGHYAAWAQGYGPGGLVEIRLADLSAGTVTTIRTGHTQPPFFDGDLVVWPESDAPGAQTTLRAYNLATGRLAALPAALRGVNGTDFVVTDGTRTAYLSPSLTSLYYSPEQDRTARLAFRLPPGQDFSDLAMAPDSLAWTTTAATYLASTRTGAFVRVTAQYGFATGSGSVMLVTDPPGQKQAHPALPLHVIDPARIGWPDCQPSEGAARRS